MSQASRSCPRCHVPLMKLESPAAGMGCPKCGHSFAQQTKKASKRTTKKEYPKAIPFAPPPQQTKTEQSKRTPPRSLLGMVVGLGAALLLIPLVCFALGFVGKSDDARIAEIKEETESRWERKTEVDLPSFKGESRFAGSKQTRKKPASSASKLRPESYPRFGAKHKQANNYPSVETAKNQPKKSNPGAPPQKADSAQANLPVKNVENSPPTGRRISAVLSDGLLPLVKTETKKTNLVAAFPKSDLKFTVRNFGQEHMGGRSLRLAVTPASWDDIGSLLNKLGDGYKYTTINNHDLRELSNLTKYDVIFLNCDSRGRDPRSTSALRQYVKQGGTIYASDLRYAQLAKTFPEFAVHVPGLRDLHGKIQANVLDPGLQRILGEKVTLRFELSHRPAAFNPKKTWIYLNTKQQSFSGGPLWVPLLTKFQCGKGHVIFTSFHNAKQINGVELKLLMYIVFAAVNSEVESVTRNAFAGDEFEATEVKNLNISQGLSLAEQKLQHDKNGKLRFAIGFRKQKAKLRLEIRTPDGKVIEHTDTESFIVEIDNAPVGNWQYSVTALQTPFDNFPFTLMVGGAKAAK